MKVLCDVCSKGVASVLCCAEEATLCESCDTKVHGTNKLATKHDRVSLLLPSLDRPVCDICQEKSAFFFCVEDRALLCRGCDVSIHLPNSLSATHRRYLLTATRVSLEQASEPSTVSGTSTDVSRLKLKTEHLEKPAPAKSGISTLTSSLLPPPLAAVNSAKVASHGPSNLGGSTLWHSGTGIYPVETSEMLPPKPMGTSRTMGYGQAGLSSHNVQQRVQQQSDGAGYNNSKHHASDGASSRSRSNHSQGFQNLDTRAPLEEDPPTMEAGEYQLPPVSAAAHASKVRSKLLSGLGMGCTSSALGGFHSSSSSHLQDMSSSSTMHQSHAHYSYQDDVRTNQRSSLAVDNTLGGNSAFGASHNLDDDNLDEGTMGMSNNVGSKSSSSLMGRGGNEFSGGLLVPPMGDHEDALLEAPCADPTANWPVDELLNIPDLADGYTLGDIGSSKAEVSNLGDFDWAADLSLFDEQMYAESMHEVPQMPASTSYSSHANHFSSSSPFGGANHSSSRSNNNGGHGGMGTSSSSSRAAPSRPSRPEHDSTAVVPDFGDSFSVPDMGLDNGPPFKRRR